MGTSGQRRRGIPHARDGDEFEPRGWTDRRTKIGSGTVGGPSEVRPLSSSNADRKRERERSLASPRELPISSNCSISPSSTFPHPPHPPSFFNFLSSPSFSIAFHAPPFLLSLSLPSSYTSIDHDILIFLFVAPSPPPSSPRSEKDSTVHGTSPRLAADTHNPPRKLRIRAQHTREREILASTASLHRQMEERPPIESRLEHLLFTFSSISTPNLPPRKIHDPEARLGRARALFLLLLLFLPPSRMSRGGSSTTTTTTFFL